jgi:hypothetical protein
MKPFFETFSFFKNNDKNIAKKRRKRKKMPQEKTAKITDKRKIQRKVSNSIKAVYIIIDKNV